MASRDRHARHARPGARGGNGRTGVAGAVALGVAALLGVGVLAGVLLAPHLGVPNASTGADAVPPLAATSAATAGAAGAAGATAATAATSPTTSAARPTLLARVTRVDTGDEITVDLAGRPARVRILGLDAPDAMAAGRTEAECGADEALRFAEDRLAGQTVTLVPDPTVPELDDRGRRLAYVVLRSQLSYTDAALLAGVARVDTSRPLWYGEVFARVQREAVDAERGLWGDPCRETPGRG